MAAPDLRLLTAAWRARHARPAWRPVTEERRGESQFGGVPRLAAGEPWPRCQACGQPMHLFVQLAMAALPAGFARRGAGLLQLFYCSRDDGSCETWRPFSGAHVARLLDAPATDAIPPAGLTPLPARAIVGWRELVDYPHPEDHGELGLFYVYDFTRNRVTIHCDDPPLELREVPSDEAAETIACAEPGDKLGGWPHWVQSAEYPACPDCGQRMELVLQLDSEDQVDHMFGDGGCGHLTQCPTHPHVLAFGWACG